MWRIYIRVCRSLTESVTTQKFDLTTEANREQRQDLPLRAIAAFTGIVFLGGALFLFTHLGGRDQGLGWFALFSLGASAVLLRVGFGGLAAYPTALEFDDDGFQFRYPHGPPWRFYWKEPHLRVNLYDYSQVPPSQVSALGGHRWVAVLVLKRKPSSSARLWGERTLLVAYRTSSISLSQNAFVGIQVSARAHGVTTSGPEPVFGWASRIRVGAPDNLRSPVTPSKKAQ